jgi:hypothetical protein
MSNSARFNPARTGEELMLTLLMRLDRVCVDHWKLRPLAIFSPSSRGA